MAGITANSASKTMTGGDTSADKVVTGYIAGERITLAATPSGTTYAWQLAAPNTSAVARSALSSTSVAGVTMMPDVAGTYVVSCLVDGATLYVIRITVQAAAVAEPVEAVRFSPRSDASIPAPAAGVTLYYSSDQDALVTKAPNGDIAIVDVTVLP